MSINIQKQFADDASFQEELLQQDRNQDGILEAGDFEPFYGKTATGRFFKKAEAALVAGDREQYRKVLDEMIATRNQRVNTLMLPTLEALAKDGVRIYKGTADFSAVKEGAANKVGALFANGLKEACKSEFGLNDSAFFDQMVPAAFNRLLPEYDCLEYSQMKNACDKGVELPLDRGIAAYLFAPENVLHWLEAARDSYLQEDYAGEQMHEYHQLKALTQLEEKYDIDIRTFDYEFKPEDIEIIGHVFKTMQSLRPDDFAAIPSVTFREAKVRAGALTERKSGNKISVYGGFQPAERGLATAPGYSADVRQVFGEYDTEAYLTHILIHEMGHVSEPFDEKHPLYYYDHLFGDNWGYKELYAEDYRIFLLSGGSEVTRYLDTGDATEEVPYYETRLEFMKNRMAGPTEKK